METCKLLALDGSALGKVNVKVLDEVAGAIVTVPPPRTILLPALTIPVVVNEAAAIAPPLDTVNVGELVAFACVVAITEVAFTTPAVVIEAFDPVHEALVNNPEKVPVVAPVKELDKISAPDELKLHVEEEDA